MPTLPLSLRKGFPSGVDQPFQYLQADKLRSTGWLVCCVFVARANTQTIAYFSLRIRRSLHDVWYTCPGIWMFLELGKDLLRNLLLMTNADNTRDETKRRRKIGN